MDIFCDGCKSVCEPWYRLNNIEVDPGDEKLKGARIILVKDSFEGF